MTPAARNDGGGDELLDQPHLPYGERERALTDLARVNRWLLGFLPLARTLLPRLAGGGRRQRLLDVGTGSGEQTAMLVRAARRRRVELEVVGVDRQLSHLVIGRRRGTAQLRVVADATALPFSSGAFDWTLSTLLFHHFDPAAKRRAVAEMRRTARRAAVIVDLRRGFLTTALARLLLPRLGLGATAVHDGLISVERGATMAEVAELAAGEPVLEIERRFPRRYSLLLAGGGKLSGTRSPADPQRR